MQDCQLPLDITKRILASNVRELERNLTNCVDSCEAITGGASDTSIFEKELYECKVGCFESNKAIMKQIEAQLGQDLPAKRKQMQDLL